MDSDSVAVAETAAADDEPRDSTEAAQAEVPADSVVEAAPAHDALCFRGIVVDQAACNFIALLVNTAHQITAHEVSGACC